MSTKRVDGYLEPSHSDAHVRLTKGWDVVMVCDGSADPQGNAGCGYALTAPGYWTRVGGGKDHKIGGSPLPFGTTNQQAEILAVVHGLSSLRYSGMKVKVISDSRYVVDAFEKGWIDNWIRKGWPDRIKNQMQWKMLIAQVEEQERVKFKWTKGHAGTFYQEEAHSYANFCRFRAIRSNLDRDLASKVKDVRRRTEVEKYHPGSGASRGT